MCESDGDDDVEYELEHFEIGAFSFQITTVSYLPITKLMELQSSNSKISGQKLWCGSLSVMEYIMNVPSAVVGCDVIELGAGTGTLGMLCMKMNARSLYLTDHDYNSLLHMKEDCDRNSINSIVQNLDWFNPDFSPYVNILSDTEVPLVVVAGDVLYKRSLLAPFFNVAVKFLERESSIMLLGHVPRAGVEHDDVLGMLDQYCLLAEEVDPQFWKKGCCLTYSPPEDLDRAKLYAIKRRRTVE